MEEKQFGTYSVIPTNVMLNKEISSTAKVLYGIISSLTNEKGYCWASNEYLGELINVSKTRISLIIKELVNNNLIESQLKENFRREIKLKGGLSFVKGGVNEKLKGGLRKVKDNNIINNINEYNNIITSEPSAQIKENPINEIFKTFYDNGNIGINFGNKTERLSAKWLFDKFGLDKTVETIKYAMSLNGKPYAPIITTPFQLKNNLSKLTAYYERDKSPKKGVVPNFNF